VKHGENPLLRSLVSTHTVLNVQDGEFISLHAPPGRFADAAAACLNVGTWPVLIGEEPERDCMLSCPRILYDYPRLPRSPQRFVRRQA
jgi:hydrogenase maturation protease